MKRKAVRAILAHQHVLVIKKTQLFIICYKVSNCLQYVEKYKYICIINI